jgi:hypothetical protein
MKATPRSGLTIGVGWYTPESYSALLNVADDADDLPDTFEEWLKQAKKVIFTLRGEGLQPEQVFVNIDELMAWCRRRRVSLNGKNRADFVSEKVLNSNPIGLTKL